MFSVHMTVRGYETDRLGHLNQAVYLSWAEHSRVELLRHAGLSLPGEQNLGIVVLEAHIRYLRELRLGDDVDVTCNVTFGEGKTFAMNSTFTRADGTLCADVQTKMGLMDLGIRRLVADPQTTLGALADKPMYLSGALGEMRQGG